MGKEPVFRTADIERLRRRFPKLTIGNSRPTSPAEPEYNCIAWAAGDDTIWWEYDRSNSSRGKVYWPPEIQEGHTIESWEKVFELEGNYRRCRKQDGTFRWGIEKIAIYEKNGVPTHVARQSASGKWTSKLGKGIDIEHKSLDYLIGFVGSEYGEVRVYMERRGMYGKRSRPPRRLRELRTNKGRS
jgi:hypothetical protein